MGATSLIRFLRIIGSLLCICGFLKSVLDLLHNIKMVFLIPNQSVSLHDGQLVGKCAALHAEIIRQLLAVVGDIKGLAAGAFDAFRKVGEQSLPNGFWAGVQHTAGKL